MIRKQLVQIIESCSQCPFRNSIEFHETLQIINNKCNHPGCVSKDKILDNKNIPEWCPLENDKV